MSRSSALAPAFVLHRRRYRDSSLLLELFTPGEGRLAAIARGALGGKRNRGGTLQPFQPLCVGWSGRGEVRTLTAAEPRSEAFRLTGKCLYCGFYINELLIYLLRRHDSHELLFHYYEQALAGLAGGQELEALLRAFELRLLTEIGYRMELRYDAGTGEPVDPRSWYAYQDEAGPVRCAAGTPGRLRGSTLLKLAANQALDEQESREAKRLIRRVLGFHLDGRELKSRELFRNAGAD